MLLAGFVIWPTWTKVQYHRFWLWETMREWSKLGGSPSGKSLRTRQNFTKRHSFGLAIYNAWKFKSMGAVPYWRGQTRFL